MPITELLERNANLYGDEVALVEINPQIPETMLRIAERKKISGKNA